VPGLFNRLTIGTTGRYAGTTQLANVESNVRVRLKESSGDTALEVVGLRRFSVFGRRETVQTRLDESGFVRARQGLSQILDLTGYGARATSRSQGSDMRGGR
jgi:hypothetical protein